MFEVEVSGLDEIRRNLEDLRCKIEALEREGIPFAELLPIDFLRKHTEFESLQDMLRASGFVVESREDFEKIPDDEWDNFVRSHTRFSSWEEMVGAAWEEWVGRKLGF